MHHGENLGYIVLIVILYLCVAMQNENKDPAIKILISKGFPWHKLEQQEILFQDSMILLRIERFSAVLTRYMVQRFSKFLPLLFYNFYHQFNLVQSYHIVTRFKTWHLCAALSEDDNRINRHKPWV